MTWNRSALLALACTVFGVIITLAALAFSVTLIPLFYAISLGFIFGLRLLVLVAIADYRVPRMILPALTQSGVGIIVGMILFSPSFAIFALVLHIVFGLGFAILIWMIERPLRRAFKIRGLAFINAFIAHMTDGSKGMEDFFREIGEEIFVPQVSFFFRREKGKPVIFTVPNLHPGPMGEIGGGNLPKVLHDYFQEERHSSPTGAQRMISTLFPRRRSAKSSMPCRSPGGDLPIREMQENPGGSRGGVSRCSTSSSATQSFW